MIGGSVDLLPFSDSAWQLNDLHLGPISLSPCRLKYLNHIHELREPAKFLIREADRRRIRSSWQIARPEPELTRDLAAQDLVSRLLISEGPSVSHIEERLDSGESGLYEMNVFELEVDFTTNIISIYDITDSSSALELDVRRFRQLLQDGVRQPKPAFRRAHRRGRP